MARWDWVRKNAGGTRTEQSASCARCYNAEAGFLAMIRQDLFGRSLSPMSMRRSLGRRCADARGVRRRRSSGDESGEAWPASSRGEPPSSASSSIYGTPRPDRGSLPPAPLTDPLPRSETPLGVAARTRPGVCSQTHGPLPPVVHWTDVGAPRATDATIFSYAQQDSLVVFRHDLDFGALLAHTRARGPSVVQGVLKTPRLRQSARSSSLYCSNMHRPSTLVHSW
jgi:hypothetical protein